jgi:hypothetical protein
MVFTVSGSSVHVDTYSLSTMFWKSCSGNWQRVLRKYYEIEDAEGNVISTVQWEQKVFLGVQVAMNFCMWHVALFDITVRCPRCAEVQLGSVAIALGPSGDLFQIWYPAHPPPILCMVQSATLTSNSSDCKFIFKYKSIVQCMLELQTPHPRLLRWLIPSKVM